MSSYHASSSSYQSTPSLVSVATTTSASSSTPLRQTSSPSAPQKDYSAAFSALQSQYGWGPATPVPVKSTSIQEKQERQKKKKAEKRRLGDARAGVISTPEVPGESQKGRTRRSRDVESTFGSLSSKLGFGGGWPTPVHRK